MGSVSMLEHMPYVIHGQNQHRLMVAEPKARIITFMRSGILRTDAGLCIIPEEIPKRAFC